VNSIEVLRDDDQGGDLTSIYGWRESDYSTPTGTPPAGATWSAPGNISRDVSDGETFTLHGWKGLALGEQGFLVLTGEYKDQNRTERDGWDFRQQYARVAGAFDPREQTIDRFNAWYGEPELEQLTFFANSGYDLSDNVRLYGWASYQDREARSAGFFRRALDDRNVIQIYPDGFLPIIAPDVTDYSFAGGVAWGFGDWQADASLVYGFNEMEFTIENTLNRSLATASPTRFDAGGFDYDQLVFNLSGIRQYELDALASPLNVAVGLEARREAYPITAGEPDSWRNGGALLPSGAPTASGAQVFPGFRPENEVDENRTAVGVFVDIGANLTERLLGSVALRAEGYSDFGSNLSGKLAGRHDFTDGFALRGSLQNGFRAPSLQQQYFATTSTNFINGVPFDIATFPVDDPVAQALGAKPLDAEESVNFSLGAVLRWREVTVTIDAYRIDIDDRIVLSENLTQANVRAYLESLGFVGVGGGRFFINGVDTETTGHRRGGQLALGDRRRRPLRLHAGRELERHRGDPRAGDRGARRALAAATAVRAGQRAQLRGRHAGRQARRRGRLAHGPLGRDAARHALRIGAGPGHDGGARLRARLGDAGGPRGSRGSDRPDPPRARRREPARRVPGPVPGLAQHHRRYALHQLRALRPLGTLRVRAAVRGLLNRTRGARRARQGREEGGGGRGPVRNTSPSRHELGAAPAAGVRDRDRHQRPLPGTAAGEPPWLSRRRQLLRATVVSGVPSWACLQLENRGGQVSELACVLPIFRNSHRP
jgi:hypothetical protein